MAAQRSGKTFQYIETLISMKDGQGNGQGMDRLGCIALS